MLKLIATPTWQFGNNKPHGSTQGSRAATVRTSFPDIKRAILPHSLDVSFALSYRR